MARVTGHQLSELRLGYRRIISNSSRAPKSSSPSFGALGVVVALEAPE